MHYKILSLLALLLLFYYPVQAQQQTQPLGIALESFEYPYPVKYIHFSIQGEDVRMAYMDVAPTAVANGKVVTLFHGKNFFGEYWHQTIKFLAANGFRVVVPDQVGFGKSSKPSINYSFHLLANSTKRLLDTLGVTTTAVIGHSMGGMVATRFALMFPDITTHMILENPIGLEDYKLKVPYRGIEEVYRENLKTTEAGVRNYHKSYYVNWKPEYDKYVMVHYRWSLSGEYPRLARADALTYQMVYTQPVVYEFSRIKVPTLLIIGQEDRTALGKNLVTEEVRKTLGQYQELGKQTAKVIPNAKLIELKNVGHTPHFEATEVFHKAVLEFLK